MAQLQVDVFEGLLCVRDAWSNVVKSVLQPGWEVNELLRLAQQGADEELQELLREGSDPPEHVLEQLPLLPALSLIDRWVKRTQQPCPVPVPGHSTVA